MNKKFTIFTALVSSIAFQAQAETINLSLAKVLELAGSNNTELILKIESARQAELDKKIAWYNWIPDLRVGGQYSKQDGLLQNTDGSTIHVERDAFSRGLGFTGTGSGLASSPGVSLEMDLADALFDTKIASSKMEAAEEAKATADAQIMLKGARIYYRLVESHRMIEVISANLGYANELAETTEKFAKEGQGLLSDSQQARVYATLMKSNLENARIQYAQAESDLTRFLALDESVNFQLEEATITPLDIYPSLPAVSQLIREALSKRPELRQAEAVLEATEQENSMQKWGPLFPTVAAYYSDAEFEGDANGIPSESADRKGYSVALFWELDGLGFKNLSNSAKSDSAVRQAQTLEAQTRSNIASEVKLAREAVKYSGNQLEILSEAAEQAREAYFHTRDRVFENNAMPLEAMQSIRLLEETERMMLMAVARYNIAQLQLLTVSGSTVRNYDLP